VELVLGSNTKIKRTMYVTIRASPMGDAILKRQINKITF